jgi:hypothetical protein
VQTFLPFKNFRVSAVSLDSKRLNKQLLEGRQILDILTSGRTTGGWVNHPAVKMWRGSEDYLYDYLVQIVRELGYRNIKYSKNWDAIAEIKTEGILGNRLWGREYPAWLGDDRLHGSHRYNLHKKDPVFYAFLNDQVNYTCCDRCNYFWPTHTSEYSVELV